MSSSIGFWATIITEKSTIKLLTINFMIVILYTDNQKINMLQFV
ncbi:hypothetical protein JCM19294_2685 [Nonlabens tegetincola]|uniref:Uncharacterized protein n=1 Tax=Nonlabens tegetincola TaxID=323273 RepID=A0A090Q2G0_9FLAO|nr:hypothetical protein JCM19294_2685 [Nonlabens tegetincola]